MPRDLAKQLKVSVHCEHHKCPKCSPHNVSQECAEADWDSCTITGLVRCINQGSSRNPTRQKLGQAWKVSTKLTALRATKNGNYSRISVFVTRQNIFSYIYWIAELFHVFDNYAHSVSECECECLHSGVYTSMCVASFYLSLAICTLLNSTQLSLVQFDSVSVSVSV